MKARRRRMPEERAKALEEGWNDSMVTRVKEYNALFDPNMRHFFETPSVQAHLLRTGQIDRNGRVIDYHKQKGKLHIIEQEFKQAEKIEFWRQKEERDMRERVQKKRALALERARKEETILRLQDDRRIRQEIVRASLEAQGRRNLGRHIRTKTSGSSEDKGRACRRSSSQADKRISQPPGKFPETSLARGKEQAPDTFVTQGGAEDRRLSHQGDEDL